MQAHEGLLASWSLGPSVPVTRSRDLDSEVGYSWIFMGWSRGFSVRVGEFLKMLGPHSDMGLSAKGNVCSFSWNQLGLQAAVVYSSRGLRWLPEVKWLHLCQRYGSLIFLGLHKWTSLSCS